MKKEVINIINIFSIFSIFFNDHSVALPYQPEAAYLELSLLDPFTPNENYFWSTKYLFTFSFIYLLFSECNAISRILEILLFHCRCLLPARKQEKILDRVLQPYTNLELLQYKNDLIHATKCIIQGHIKKCVALSIRV